uniref:DUF4258 domain-containing protein n=1 Tax=Acetithermum autotrophicum TaxID=1446466 RepID=H5SU95_ACEAU|nr:hypothetical protein HGMM_OP4C731 [Candidatus Acetothermum autotrophicum]
MNRKRQRLQIQIDPHTLERAKERGAHEKEIRDVIETGFPISAKYGRLGKAKIYRFNRKRHGRLYRQKRVEVIYAMEGNVAVTVTVYVFYGQWEVDNADFV